MRDKNSSLSRTTSTVGQELAKHRGTKEAYQLSDTVKRFLIGKAGREDVLQAYQEMTQASQTKKPRL
jgi:hypothetical protein